MILKAPRPLNFHSISTKNAQTGLVSVKQKSKSSRNAGVPGARSAEGLSPGKSECNAQREFFWATVRHVTKILCSPSLKIKSQNDMATHRTQTQAP